MKLNESILKNLNERIDHDYTRRMLNGKYDENTGDYLSRRLDYICTKVKESKTILYWVSWKPAEEYSFYIIPDIDDYYVKQNKDRPGFEKRFKKSLDSIEETIRVIANSYFPSAEVFKEGNRYVLKLDSNEVSKLVPKVKRHSEDEIFEECKKERLSKNFESFVDEVERLYNADELSSDEAAKNLIKKYNLTWLYFACAHCYNYDRIRPSRLRSFHSYEDNPLAEGLADLYLMGNAGRDSFLCRSCARSER